MVASTAGDWLKHETGDERDRWSQLEKSETIRFSNGSKSQPTPGWKDTRTRRGYLGSLARTGTIYGRLQGWEVKNGRDKADTWEGTGGKLNVRRNAPAPPSSQPQVSAIAPAPKPALAEATASQLRQFSGEESLRHAQGGAGNKEWSHGETGTSLK